MNNNLFTTTFGDNRDNLADDQDLELVGNVIRSELEEIAFSVDVDFGSNKQAYQYIGQDKNKSAFSCHLSFPGRLIEPDSVLLFQLKYYSESLPQEVEVILTKYNFKPDK